MNMFLEKAISMKETTLQDRRYIHKHAEAGIHLPQTTAYIMKRLREMGMEPEEICDSAVAVTIYGGKPGKTILLRCDTDALPMGEDNNLPFKSITEDAHNCGHDLHTAMLLSAAQILHDMSGELEGNVKLMFQPAEELFAGSQKMIQAGILNNPKVDAALGIHTMLDAPSPSLGYSSENMTSSCDGFKITLTGNGCHGASPHMGVDPINAGVHLYLAYQELIAREVPPMDTASLTFGQFAAGNSSNIIPHSTVLQGTLRTYNKDVREKLVIRMREIADAIENMFRVKVEYEVLSSIPSTYTDPKLLGEMVDYVKQIDENIVHFPNYKVTPSDDFAFISAQVPTVYFMLGCKEKECPFMHHNKGVLFDESAMPYGVALHVQCAVEWLKNNK